MNFSGIYRIMKRWYLVANDKTVGTRFSFDAEYGRWESFNNQRGKRSANARAGAVKKQSIRFLVPGVAISGGIAVILRYANELSQRGYDVKILSLAKNNDARWYRNQGVEIVPYSETKRILKNGSIDILFATAYSTAFTVDMAVADRKLYFIQSDESRFSPEDEKLIEQIRLTYTLPLEQIVAVTWLRDWLRKEFGKDAIRVPNGLDLDIFQRVNPIVPKTSRLRVLLEGGIDIPYKGMADAYEAVKNLDCEIWIVSNKGRPKKEWRCDRFFENVPIDEMAGIYSSCDVLLKMSKVESFSYPPLEMMACGGIPVIRSVTGIEEYAIHEYNCLIVEDIEGARKAVERLKGDARLCESLIASGLKTAKEWDWDRSIDLFETVIS